LGVFGQLEKRLADDPVIPKGGARAMLTQHENDRRRTGETCRAAVTSAGDP
jgi:hypothetical protein